MTTSFNHSLQEHINELPNLVPSTKDQISSLLHIEKKSLSLNKVARTLIEILNQDNAYKDISTTLAYNIAMHQERFLSALSLLMTEHGINQQEKLILGLGADNQLIVLNQHLQKEIIQRVLDSFPELSYFFVEVASQSSLLQNLKSLVSLSLASLEDQDNLSLLPIPPYQCCIKGEMSHFFFSHA